MIINFIIFLSLITAFFIAKKYCRPLLLASETFFSAIKNFPTPHIARTFNAAINLFRSFKVMVTNVFNYYFGSNGAERVAAARIAAAEEAAVVTKIQALVRGNKDRKGFKVKSARIDDKKAAKAEAGVGHVFTHCRLYPFHNALFSPLIEDDLDLVVDPDHPGIDTTIIIFMESKKSIKEEVKETGFEFVERVFGATQDEGTHLAYQLMQPKHNEEEIKRYLADYEAISKCLPSGDISTLPVMKDVKITKEPVLNYLETRGAQPVTLEPLNVPDEDDNKIVLLILSAGTDKTDLTHIARDFESRLSIMEDKYPDYTKSVIFHIENVLKNIPKAHKDKKIKLEFAGHSLGATLSQKHVGEVLKHISNIFDPGREDAGREEQKQYWSNVDEIVVNISNSPGISIACNEDAIGALDIIKNKLNRSLNITMNISHSEGDLVQYFFGQTSLFTRPLSSIELEAFTTKSIDSLDEYKVPNGDNAGELMRFDSNVDRVSYVKVKSDCAIPLFFRAKAHTAGARKSMPICDATITSSETPSLEELSVARSLNNKARTDSYFKGVMHGAVGSLAPYVWSNKHELREKKTH